MKTLTKDVLIRISRIHQPGCITIMMPVHESGEAVLNKQDQIVLKNLLKEAELKGLQMGYNVDDLTEILNPATELLNDGAFWRHQRSGLVLFLAKGLFEVYQLAGGIDEKVEVSHQFAIKPLLGLMEMEVDFYLLKLGLKGARFYQFTGSELVGEPNKEMIPENILEVVGGDLIQKVLTMHSGFGGQGGYTYHGHGEGKDDKEKEVSMYFRSITDATEKQIAQHPLPVVIAGLTEQVALYQQISKTPAEPNLIIARNPDVYKLEELVEEALVRVMKNKEEKESNEKVALVRQHYLTELGSIQLSDIIPAAVNGRVDTLFLDRDFEQWGIYDDRKAQVLFSDSENVATISLTSLAAISVLENGGRVFVVRSDEMPVKGSGVNALYRY